MLVLFVLSVLAIWKCRDSYCSILLPPSLYIGRNRAIRDLKHHDGRYDDGITEVNFPFRSCAEPEKLIAICRRPVVGDATFTVFT